MRNLATTIDSIADALQVHGLSKLAAELDTVANTLTSATERTAGIYDVPDGFEAPTGAPEEKQFVDPSANDQRTKGHAQDTAKFENYVLSITGNADVLAKIVRRRGTAAGDVKMDKKERWVHGTLSDFPEVMQKAGKAAEAMSDLLSVIRREYPAARRERWQVTHE